MNIESKTVLITDENRGLRKALVNEALIRGAKRVHAGTRSALQVSDERVTSLALDVTNLAQIQRGVENVESFDILINNADAFVQDDLSGRARLFNEAVVLCICRAPCSAGHHSTPKFTTTSGHTCLTPGNSCDIRYAAHPGTASFSAVIRCSALALRVHSQLAARRQAFDGRDGLRSQPVGSARERRTPARHVAVVCPPSRLLAYLSIPG
jgi:hypothetical protein